MVEPGQIEQAKEPESREEKDVGEEEPGNAEQCGGDEESHPEEDGERLQSPLHLVQSCTMDNKDHRTTLHRDRERRELDPEYFHFFS